jgi:hypothetical protein
MKYSSKIVWIVWATAVLLWTSCEEEIFIDLPNIKDKIVVEGYIETGLPPYVILTRSQPFFGGLDLNDLGSYFIRDARVVVYSETDSVELVQYDRLVLSLLPQELLQELARQFGLEIETIDDIPDIVIYTVDPNAPFFVGEVNRSYRLKIEVDDKVLTSTTHIPYPVQFDSMYIQAHPNPDNDTLVQLWGRMKDPDTLGNYYRYFTRTSESPWLTSFTTVFDDAFVNGREFPIFIPKGISLRQRSDGDFNQDTYGYWKKTDTCYVKLSTIDKPHYLFWRTLEADRGSQGNPFGSFVVVKTNIEGGGIGVWGGYASTINVYIPEP